MARKNAETSMSEQVRAAILGAEEAGMNWSELGRRAGVSLAQISRFIHGQRGISLDVAEKLCRVLGLTLRPGPA